MGVIVAHDQNCPDRGKLHSDAAKRISDTYRMHRAALGQQSVGQWFAARLSDGATDNQLYASRRDAIRFQHHNEKHFAFVCIGPADMGVCEAEGYMLACRAVADAGLRLTDPDRRGGGPELISRATIEDQRSLIASVRSRGRVRPTNLVWPN